MLSHLSPLKSKYAKIDPIDREDVREHINLSNYIAHGVDPLLKDCVVFLLCNKPRDVLDIMIAYFRHAFARQTDPEMTDPFALPPDAHKSADPLKRYFNSAINPLLKKIMREVSIHQPRPENIVGFMCEELIKVQHGESSLVEDRSFQFHHNPRAASGRPSTTDGNFSSRQPSRVNDGGRVVDSAPLDESSLGSQRPKTTGRFVAVPDFVDLVAPDGHVEDVVFYGGHLRLDILHAEKYSGDGGVFGMGRYQSAVALMCRGTLLKRVPVSAGALDDDGKWAGYEADIGTVELTPELGSSVEIVVYDCDRLSASTALGSAKLVLDTITKKASFQCILPIENNLNPGYSALGVAIQMNPCTIDAADSLDIDSQSNVGQITLAVHFDPYTAYPLEALKHDAMDVTFIRSMGFGVSWEPKELNDGMGASSAKRFVNSRFGAALCMFDQTGRFLDGVDMLQKYSRKGPPTKFKRVLGENNVGKDIDEIVVNIKHKSQRYDTNRCFLYFIMLVAKDGASLSELSSAYVQVKDGHTKVPFGRFDIDLVKALAISGGDDASAVILARVWRNFDNPAVRNYCTNVVLKTYILKSGMDYKAIWNHRAQKVSLRHAYSQS